MIMQMQLLHGTNIRFAQFDQGKARLANDYYGGGVAYFTDDLETAKGYATAAFKKSGGDKLIYKVNLTINKLFDVDHTFTGKELTQFITRQNSEQFARGAGLLSLGRDKYSVLYDLESGSISLSGDQVFRGLSGGMIGTAKARDQLISLGYDTLRYNGGQMAIKYGSKHHNVYIAYKASNIKIIEPRMIVASETEKKEGPVGKEQYVLV